MTYQPGARVSDPHKRNRALELEGERLEPRSHIERLCLELAWRGYERAPPGADALIHFGRRYVVPLLRYRVPLARVRGRTLADGEPGSMLVAGRGAPLLHLQRQFFAHNAETESLGSCPIHALPRTLLALGANDDLIVARVPRPFAGRLFDRRYLRMPDLVDVWIDVRDRDRTLRTMSQTMRHTARDLVANGYSWAEARDITAFERFYEHYYLPFVTARHAELAVVRERSVLRRYFRTGSILWILQNGIEVAGVLQHADGHVLAHLAVGTRKGDLAARRRGALNATNLFGIELAAQRGFAWVNLGGCLPSPTAGTLAHKRAWGGELRERHDSHHDLLLRWPRFTERVAQFLRGAPLIVRDHDGLAALSAMSNTQSAEPRLALRLWRQWQMPGLRRLYVLNERGWRAWSKGDAHPTDGTLWLSGASSVEDTLLSAWNAAYPARDAA